MLEILIIAILPSIFWLWIYLREDRRDPEPRKMILKLFILGIFAGILSLIAEFILAYFLGGGQVEDSIVFQNSGKNNFWGSFLIYILAAPLIEESLKYSVIKKFAFPAKSFNQVIDGVIYAVSVALGFAMLENFIYFSGFFSGSGYFFAGGFIYRTFFSTLLHSLSTGWMGYWIGRARFAGFERTKLLAVGLVFAIIIHIVFNFFMSYSMVFSAIFTLVVAFDLLFIRLRAHESQKIWRGNIK